MKALDEDICALCGGTKQSGTTTFSADLGFGILVIRNVPALVCSQCGEDWIADADAVRIDAAVQDARKKNAQVEVVAFEQVTGA